MFGVAEGSSAKTGPPRSLVSGRSFGFHWVKPRKCVLCTVWGLTYLQNNKKKMVSKFNYVLAHFVTFSYFSRFFFLKGKNPSRFLNPSLE